MRFVTARDAGDASAAAASWERLVVAHRDRVEIWVSVWKHPTNGQRIPRSDVEDVLQDALIRATVKLLRNFYGSSLGEFRAALKTCTERAAHDAWRRWVRHDKQAAGSIDEPLGETGDAGRYDANIAAEDPERGIERLDAHLTISRCLPLVPNEKQRAVLQMDMDGYPDDEIAQTIGVSVDYVYKLRERATKKLKEVMDDVDR